MSSDLARTIERLLFPTDAVNRWYDEVKALPPAGAVPLLAAVLREPARSPSDRHQAATMLGLVGTAAAVPTLVEATGSADPVLRAVAAEALGRTGATHSDAVRALLDATRDGDYFVRESAARALALVKPPEALPLLERMRDHDEVPGNREVAAAAIDAIRGNA